MSDATDTTECGVLILEPAWTRQWPGNRARGDGLGGFFRFGITPKLEIRWGTDGAMFHTDEERSTSGIGETYVGTKYRLREQSSRFPSVALRYTLKIPTASPAKELGTGFHDHEIGVLFSKDYKPVHLDFSIFQTLSGNEPGEGMEHTTRLALSGTRDLTRRLGAYLEAYGQLPLEKDDPPFAGSILGLSYRLNRRFAVFSAVDFAVTDNLPRKRFLFTLSYAITNLYSLLKPGRTALAKQEPSSPVGPEMGHNPVQ